MNGSDVVGLVGKGACSLVHLATNAVGMPYDCRPAEYFDTGAAVLALAALTMVVALWESRRRNNRPEGYR